MQGQDGLVWVMRGMSQCHARVADGKGTEKDREQEAWVQKDKKKKCN